MKKLGILVMPLMAVSLLASCGESKPVDPLKIDLYKKMIEYDNTGKNIVSTTICEYNNKGLCVKDTRTETNPPYYKDVHEHTYDEHENEICSHSITYDGEEIKSQDWMRFDYTYSEQGRITKQEIKASSDNKEWQLIEYYVVEYKENVNVVENYNRDGSLDYTTTLTFDNKGNLISEKTVYSEEGGGLIAYDWEDIYTVDEHGCATTIDHYVFRPEGKKLSRTTKITYLKNLWYRPLKEVIEHIIGEETSYSTIEREYDKKNRIKLYKEYKGKEEGDSYTDYYTYEY